jgi:hypothetical protein
MTTVLAQWADAAIAHDDDWLVISEEQDGGEERQGRPAASLQAAMAFLRRVKAEGPAGAHEELVGILLGLKNEKDRVKKAKGVESALERATLLFFHHPGLLRAFVEFLPSGMAVPCEKEAHRSPPAPKLEKAVVVSEIDTPRPAETGRRRRPPLCLLDWYNNPDPSAEIDTDKLLDWVDEQPSDDTELLLVLVISEQQNKMQDLNALAEDQSIVLTFAAMAFVIFSAVVISMLYFLRYP